MKVCPYCGKKIEESKKVCPYCGKALEDKVIKKEVKIKQESKSKLLAGILGILGGAFGIHNFYLGKYELGLAQFILTLIWHGFAFIGILEGVLILLGVINKDAKGKPLK
jgi:TM2 domain-containing membrane protein YozV